MQGPHRISTRVEISRIRAEPLLTHSDHFTGRGMKLWRNIQAYFSDLRHRPLPR
jgi:hypothetical protein